LHNESKFKPFDFS